jgi:hypothetical protein
MCTATFDARRSVAATRSPDRGARIARTALRLPASPALQNDGREIGRSVAPRALELGCPPPCFSVRHSPSRGPSGARPAYVALPVTVIRRARIVGALALISSVVLTLVVVLFTLFALYSAAQDREGGYCESIDHPARCESERLLGLVGLSVT